MLFHTGETIASDDQCKVCTCEEEQSTYKILCSPCIDCPEECSDDNNDDDVDDVDDEDSYQSSDY